MPEVPSVARCEPPRSPCSCSRSPGRRCCVLAGGFDTEVLGTRITTNEPLRPLLIASVMLSVFILAGGVVRSVRSLGRRGARDPSRRCRDRACRSSRGRGDRLRDDGGERRGCVRIREPGRSLAVAAACASSSSSPRKCRGPARQWTFAPLGYRADRAARRSGDRADLLAGLPLIMAAAKLVGGQPALYRGGADRRRPAACSPRSARPPSGLAGRGPHRARCSWRRARRSSSCSCGR